MLRIIEGMPPNVVAVTASGKVTGEDYETLLMPLVEEKLRQQAKIRLLYVMGEEFAGFTAEAIWDDARIRFGNYTAFDKVAIVSDLKWVTNAVRFFSFAIPCPVRVFGNQKLAEAKQWVAE